MTQKSREERIIFHLKVVHALLSRTEEMLQGDTEYLREEVLDLLDRADLLLKKTEDEKSLFALQTELHQPIRR